MIYEYQNIIVLAFITDSKTNIYCTQYTLMYYLIFSRYTDPNHEPRVVYSKKVVRRMPSAPVLPSRDIFRRSNRSNNGIVASESGVYIIHILTVTLPSK